MQTIKLGQLQFQSKSKRKAGEGKESGSFKFFTSSQIQKKFVDEFDFIGPALIFGTGGSASIHYCDEQFSTSTDCFILRTEDSSIDLKYVSYFLKGNISILENGFKGAGLEHISKEYISNIQIPLPSLSEQKTIVEKLDKISNLINLKKESIYKTDKLTKSVFLEMFGDPMINNKKWDVKKLGDFSIQIGSGSTPLGGESVYLKEGNIKFIRSQNVRMFEFDYSNVFYIDEKIHNSMKRTWLKNEDLLLNITGASIGRLAIYKGLDNQANVNQHVCIIRLNKMLNNTFAMYYYGNEDIQNVILSQQAGATRQAFNFVQIKNFDIFYPPLILQEKFASIVHLNQITLIIQKQSLTRLEDLYNSTMQESFNY